MAAHIGEGDAGYKIVAANRHEMKVASAITLVLGN
jgi:hypothetical protein